jgi:glycosyltransferase involved in cell wall biosynthesis
VNSGVKKIVFISNDASVTGAPVFLKNFLLHLNRAGLFQEVAFFSRPGLIHSALVENGIRSVSYAKYSAGKNAFFKVVLRIRYYLIFGLFLLRERPDVVYSNTILNVGECCLAGFIGIPVVVHVHEGETLLWRFRRRVQLSLFFATRVIAGSRYCQEALERVVGTRATVIYNGIHSGALLKRCRRWGAEVTLAVLGTVHENKGQHIAISALSTLISSGRHVRLLIGGGAAEDAYLARLKAQVMSLGLTQRVEFCGFVENSVSFIRSVDILLVPSRDEVFPTVILEAFSVGTPVVASDVGGIREMIETGSHGLLFGYGDSTALARNVETLIDNSALAEKLAAGGARRLTDEFDVKACYLRIINILNEI